MIVKKIPARPNDKDSTTGRADHARALVDYLRLPEKASDERDLLIAYMISQKLDHPSDERLFHVGARGFISTDMKGQRSEMIALANAANRSSNPVDHWLISWREDEFPTEHDVDQTVDIFLRHLGMQDQPCFYACHGDTHNRHVHIALNRYDAQTGRMREINDGFNLEAAHQAVALITHQFGWKSEENARYKIVDGLPVLTRKAQARKDLGHEPLKAAATKSETRTGYASAQRLAQKHALPVILRSMSWDDLHADLAKLGARYELAGTNGAIIEIAGQKVKSSNIHRSITPSRLEKRLGPFRKPANLSQTDKIITERLPEAFRADEYKAERETWDRMLKAERNKRRSLGSTDQTECATGPSRARKPPPDLESWYYAQREGMFAQRWRHRKSVAPLPSITGVGFNDEVERQAVDGFIPFRCSDGWRYARGPHEPTAFIDRGSKIAVVDQSEDALLAALRLAAVKSGGNISLKGNAEFRENAYRVADRYGLGQFIKDPDFIIRRAAEEAARNRSHTFTLADRNGQSSPIPQQQEQADANLRPQDPARIPFRHKGLRRPKRLAHLRKLPRSNLGDRQQNAEGELSNLSGLRLRRREDVLQCMPSLSTKRPSRQTTERMTDDEAKPLPTPSMTQSDAPPKRGILALAASLEPPATEVQSKGPSPNDPPIDPRTSGRSR